MKTLTDLILDASEESHVPKIPPVSVCNLPLLWVIVFRSLFLLFL